MAKTMASLQAFPSSLLPRACSRALTPFPFPFKRLPRWLPLGTPGTMTTIWGLHTEKKKRLHFLCLAAKASETKNTSP